MSCVYSESLGKLNDGIHSYRLFNLAIMDVIFTILGSYFIYLCFPKYGFINILIFLFILGIILHRMFCVKTTVDKILFNNKYIYI